MCKDTIMFILSKVDWVLVVVVIIKSENIDTLYYFTARPNTEMRLYFIYNPTPEDIHSNPEQVVYPIQTTTIDTISLSYSIDCNSF